MHEMELCRLTLLCLTLNAVSFCFSLPGQEEEERRVLGKQKFQEILRMSESDSCWKNAVSQLKTRCKSLSDIEQSRLAVAFANCHLQKSGRKTYFCDDTMTIKDCTVDMNSLAFQTYTEFFTHTGHICYFLQNLLWQQKAENVIFELSETSSETVKKLQTSLEHHKAIEKKQNEVLDAFTTMKELAQKQRDLLWEVYSNLKLSIESVRYITSLFLIELIGIETFVVAIASWVVIYFLPRYNYSRFWLNMLLISEQAVEIIIRRAYGRIVKETTDDVTSLYSWIWACRYMSLCLGMGLYFFNWLKHSNPVHRNLTMLKEIQKDIRRLSHRVSGAVMDSLLLTNNSPSQLPVGAGACGKDGRAGTDTGTSTSDMGIRRTTQGSFTKAVSIQEPPFSPTTDWRMIKYLKSLPSGASYAHSRNDGYTPSDSEDNSDSTWKGSSEEQYQDSVEQVPYQDTKEQPPLQSNHYKSSIHGGRKDLEPQLPLRSADCEKEVSEEKTLSIMDRLERRPGKKNKMKKQSINTQLDTGVDINYFVESPEKLYRLLQTIPHHYLKPHLYNLRSSPGGYNLRPRSSNS